MSVEWIIREADPPEIKCPYCDHQASPPVYPYCEHTVFVYVDNAGDCAGFDFVAGAFAAGYLTNLKASEHVEDVDLTSETEQRFLQNKMPSLDQQTIELFRDLVSDDLFSSDATVLDVTEALGPYPTRVVVAFQIESIDESAAERVSSLDRLRKGSDSI